MKKLIRTSQLPAKEIVDWLSNKKKTRLKPSKIRKHHLINELGALCQNGDDPKGVGEKYLLEILSERPKGARILAYYNLANQPNDKHAEVLAQFRGEPRNACLLTKIDRLLNEQDII